MNLKSKLEKVVPKNASKKKFNVILVHFFENPTDASSQRGRAASFRIVFLEDIYLLLYLFRVVKIGPQTSSNGTVAMIKVEANKSKLLMRKNSHCVVKVCHPDSLTSGQFEQYY